MTGDENLHQEHEKQQLEYEIGSLVGCFLRLLLLAGFDPNYWLNAKEGALDDVAEGIEE